MVMASSLLTCGLVKTQTPLTLSLRPYGAAVPNSLIQLLLAQALLVWCFHTFCVPFLGFVLSYLRVKT